MSLDLLQEFGNPSQQQDPEWTSPLASSQSHYEKGCGTTEEDDFGEFEQPKVPNEAEIGSNDQKTYMVPSVTTAQNHDQLLIDTETIRPPPSPSFQELNAHLKLSIPLKNSQGVSVNSKPEETTPVTAWPSYGPDRAKSFGKPLPLFPYTDDDDHWGDFQKESQAEHGPSEQAETTSSKVHVSAKQELKQDASLLNLMDSLETASSPATTVPEPVKFATTGPAPSNIPPPSVLLSIVTSILGCLPEEIRVIVSFISTSLMNDTSPSDDAIFETLIGKVSVINASARILAGRKLRWRRDTHLAQRMSIGPANAGKTGGMKLTGVDRTESRREDQEATEMVRTWKYQLGGLKSHIARINAQQSEAQFALPDMSDSIPIRVVKLSEGGLTASKCCFLCGLKRDERVARLDVNVEDSFGEWWIDHWGHVDCIRFWEEHKDSLVKH
ncbi:MAG: hypothetical protein Q9182_007534 [Xanthomendoza sp. 2 TL-2023]